MTEKESVLPAKVEHDLSDETVQAIALAGKDWIEELQRPAMEQIRSGYANAKEQMVSNEKLAWISLILPTIVLVPVLWIAAYISWKSGSIQEATPLLFGALGYLGGFGSAAVFKK